MKEFDCKACGLIFEAENWRKYCTRECTKAGRDEAQRLDYTLALIREHEPISVDAKFNVWGVSELKHSGHYVRKLWDAGALASSRSGLIEDVPIELVVAPEVAE